MDIAILDRYNDWEILDKSPIRKNGKLYVKCKCKCGRESEIYLYSLKKDISKRCSSCAGKLIKLSVEFTNTWKGNKVGELCGTMFTYIRAKARQRNLEFNVSKEFLWNLLCKQDHKCALTGIPIKLSTIVKNGHVDFHNITASLDRINSNIGYIENNLQWVHKHINIMKMNLNEDYFIDMCNKVTQWQKK